MIHDNVCDSEKLNAVSFEAAELWFRLITLVDDNGNYYRRALRVYAAAMPEKKGCTESSTEAALKELEKAHLIATYVADNRPYLHIVNFEKHQDLRQDLPADVGHPIHPAELGEGYTTDRARRSHCKRTADEPQGNRSGTGTEPIQYQPETKVPVTAEVEVEVEVEGKGEVEGHPPNQYQSGEPQEDCGNWAAFVGFFRKQAGGSRDFGRFRENQEAYESLCRKYGSDAVEGIVQGWVESRGGKKRTKQNRFACKNFLADAADLIEDGREEVSNAPGSLPVFVDPAEASN